MNSGKTISVPICQNSARRALQVNVVHLAYQAPICPSARSHAASLDNLIYSSNFKNAIKMLALKLSSS